MRGSKWDSSISLLAPKPLTDRRKRGVCSRSHLWVVGFNNLSHQHCLLWSSFNRKLGPRSQSREDQTQVLQCGTQAIYSASQHLAQMLTCSALLKQNTPKTSQVFLQAEAFCTLRRGLLQPECQGSKKFIKGNLRLTCDASFSPHWNVTSDFKSKNTSFYTLYPCVV